jgi:hypothetical protein
VREVPRTPWPPHRTPSAAVGRNSWKKTWGLRIDCALLPGAEAWGATRPGQEGAGDKDREGGLARLRSVPEVAGGWRGLWPVCRGQGLLRAAERGTEWTEGGGQVRETVHVLLIRVSFQKVRVPPVVQFGAYGRLVISSLFL